MFISSVIVLKMQSSHRFSPFCCACPFVMSLFFFLLLRNSVSSLLDFKPRYVNYLSQRMLANIWKEAEKVWRAYLTKAYYLWLFEILRAPCQDAQSTRLGDEKPHRAEASFHRPQLKAIRLSSLPTIRHGNKTFPDLQPQWSQPSPEKPVQLTQPTQKFMK